MTNTPIEAKARELLVEQPREIHVIWSDDGRHIRKWAFTPFEGSTAFVAAPPNLEGAEKRAREALRTIAFMRPAGDVSRCPSSEARKLVERMERLAIDALREEI